MGWTGIEQADLGPDTFVEVRSTGRAVQLRIENPRIEFLRNYLRDDDGKLVAEHMFISIDKAHREKPENNGLGTRIFARSVEALRAGGFDRIRADAAGAAGDLFNGYYTWARLGFEGDIPGHLRLPPNLRGAKTVQDLFETEAGALWWKTRGEDTKMQFELDPGSRSSRALERYLAIRRERGDEAERHDEQHPEPQREDGRRGRAEEIELDADEEAALDEAWARYWRERGTA